MNWADLYGRGTSMGGVQAVEQSAAEASGPPETGVRPALFWAALVGLLILARILWESAK
jgi:hypothetical protein